MKYPIIVFAISSLVAAWAALYVIVFAFLAVHHV